MNAASRLAANESLEIETFLGILGGLTTIVRFRSSLIERRAVFSWQTWQRLWP